MKKALFLIISLCVIFSTYATSEKGSITLHKERYRPVDSSIKLSKEFKTEIRADTKGLSDNDIIIYCKNKTQDLLTFSTKCEKFDDRRRTKMHCVGYAQVYSAICNYALTINGKKGVACPVVGSVYWNNIKLNEYSKYLPEKWKNFTKDHDFVEVKLSNNRIIYVDPLLDVITE